MNIFVIHSYNGDTADSFAPSVEKLAEENHIEYVFPHFPVRSKASYESWSAVMDKYRSLINEETVIIAHSLGTLFIPRYIAGHQLKIRAYISVAGYMNYEGRADLEEIMKNFYPSEEDFSECEKLISQRYSLYSDHDRMNERAKLIRYADLLNADQIMVAGAGHFDPQAGIREIIPLNEILLGLISEKQ